MLEIHFLELPKIKNFQADSPIMFWLEFINNPESEKIKHIYALEEIYEEAKEAYDQAIADLAVQEFIRIRQKAEMDYKDSMARKFEEGLVKGEAKGLAEGEKKKAVETAKNFLKMGLSISQVARGTGLLIEETEKLK